uniref:Sec-independent protein translocase protein TatC n=1 Tax=Candidatus Midichloria mitochondrii TaxID=234827 RepID=H6QXR8_9RICK|nr:sec-independent protein translocase [Candidatus Midichloria mitochondrii]
MAKEKLVRKTFEEHYRDLKLRVISAVLWFILCTIICFFIAEEIYNILVVPLAEAFNYKEGRRLIFTGLAEGLTTHVKLSLYAWFFLSFPFIIAQVYLFITPGLYKREKIIFLSYVISSTLLFGLGIAMVYFLVIPGAWRFFLSFEKFGFDSNLPILLEARISEYLDLILDLIIGFGLAFQLPIILVILISMEVIKVGHLVRFRRYAIVIIFIIAAILTPPDVFSQITLALPLLLLYEISIILGKLIRKNVGRKIY